MELNELIEITKDELIRRIESSHALGVFAARRSKFEGWLKVELIDILIAKNRENVLPELGFIDITFEDVAIELKTVNTNYRIAGFPSGNRPITDNIAGIVEDIESLRLNSNFKNKFIIFIVFPLPEGHGRWSNHINVIEEKLGEVCCPQPFEFRNGTPGVIYYGKLANR